MAPQRIHLSVDELFLIFPNPIVFAHSDPGDFGQFIVLYISTTLLDASLYGIIL